jgi:hypothetical protein
MGNLGSYTNTFVAGTKAKASEVNTNFSEIRIAHNNTDSELPSYNQGNRVIVSNSDQDGMEEATTTTTEVNYLSGVTSNVQDQLDSKVDDPATETHGGTGQITYVEGDMLYSDGDDSLTKLSIGEEGQYLKVSSGIPSWGSGPTAEFVQNLIWQIGSDEDHDINFYCPASNYVASVMLRDENYEYSSTTVEGSLDITKKLDASWEVGDDKGGLESGSSLGSDTVLYGFLIKDGDDIDFIFTEDETGDDALTDSGYGLISAAPVAILPPLDGSSNIINHIAIEITGGGAEVRYKSDSAFYGVLELTLTADESGTLTATAPPNTRCIFYGEWWDNTEQITFTEKNTNLQVTQGSLALGTTYMNDSIYNLWIDGDREIDYEHVAAGVSPAHLYIQGYTIARRPLA